MNEKYTASIEPAFPLQKGTNPEGIEAGMTMREWYAGMALQGIMSNPETFKARLKPNEAAEGAFNIADAMLAQAKK